MFPAGDKNQPRDNSPRTDEPQLAEAMKQGALKVFVTLAGAATGMYVAFFTPNGIVYVGTVAGVAGLYGLYRILMGLARHWGATSYEIVQHENK